jgi:hypothetical protein
MRSVEANMGNEICAQLEEALAKEKEQGKEQIREKFLECFQKKYENLPAEDNGYRAALADFLHVLGDKKYVLRDADIALLSKLAQYNFNGGKNNGGRSRRTVRPFEELTKDIPAYNRISGLIKEARDFLEKDSADIQEFVLPRIDDERVKEDLAANLRQLKDNLAEIMRIINVSDIKIIKDSDFQENFNHGTSLVLGPIKCILQTQAKIENSENLGAEIGDMSPAEIEPEKLVLYNKEDKRYGNKINLYVKKAVVDCKRFNAYLRKCVNDEEYLRSQMGDREEEMYKLSK